MRDSIFIDVIYLIELTIHEIVFFIDRINVHQLYKILVPEIYHR